MFFAFPSSLSGQGKKGKEREAARNPAWKKEGEESAFFNSLSKSKRGIDVRESCVVSKRREERGWRRPDSQLYEEKQLLERWKKREKGRPLTASPSGKKEKKGSRI